MRYSVFTNSDYWTGSYYELSIEFHPAGNDQRLNEALTALQLSDFVSDLYDQQMKPVRFPISIEPSSIYSFYGMLTLSDVVTLPCLISIIRTDEESDWLDFSFPLASFEKNFLLKYPLTKELNLWLGEVDKLFIKLAEFIYKQSPFDFAMIGEEISGYTDQENLKVDCLDTITCLLPFELQRRLGVQKQGKILSNQLRLYCKS
ncbi:hypothetical protein M3182_08875 [Mesobacillus maritimus]|uniref:hypothetical protein n=1 Tax=Mesobacillus maritimus TaxID=1643336 RepID=UPI00203F3DF5|nr:hypothetical protein [Mesobacillus maritimus]MCM3585855.1 hypothetical protein [Mesobacillus maritimus]